jgi:hypothetical protein
MQFTAREMKLVGRLRKQERQWPRLRWLLLGGGIFFWACYGYIVISLIDNVHSAETGEQDFLSHAWLFGFALLWPKCLLGIAIGAWLIVVAIRDWHGNVNRMLLLKLLDAQQKESARDEHAI